MLLPMLLALAAAAAGEVFSRSAVLDPAGRLLLAWGHRRDTITFELTTRSLPGWVSIGFSSTGAMGGADIVVAGFQADGTAYLVDRHGPEQGNGFPPQDSTQDYQLLRSFRNSTHMIFRFSRKLETCDSEDYPISKDTVRVIWAYGPSDAFGKHQGFQSRGSKSMLLLDEPQEDAAVRPDALKLELRPHHNVSLPNHQDSLYWCTIHKLPMERGPMQELQMVKFGPLVERGHEGFVHHAVVYHCLWDMEAFVGKGAPCFDFNDPEFENPMKACSQRYLAGWAVGGGDVVFPQDMGFPVMEEGTSPYVMLEMHYDNPQMVQNLMDNSGMALWLEPYERPIDVGNIILGLGVSPWDFFIPPKQEKFTWYSVCRAACTEQFPAEGIKFMNVFPHAHLTGSGLRLRHVRDGVELPPIYSDDHYDFNYQEQRMLNPNPTILPGRVYHSIGWDVLITECDFDTRKRDKVTFAGYSSRDEMCLIFANFYPKEADSMITCMGGPNPDSWGALLNITMDDQKEAKHNTDVVHLSGPEGQHVPLKDYINRVYDKDEADFEDKVAALVDFIPKAGYFELCGGRDATDDVNAEAVQERHHFLRRKRSPRVPANLPAEKGEAMEKLKWHFAKVQGLYAPDVPYVPPQVCPADQLISSRGSGDDGRDANRPYPPPPQLYGQGRRPDVAGATGWQGSGDGAVQRTEAAELEPAYQPMDEPYDHEAWLDSGRDVHAVWLLRGDTMTIEVHARTLGWLGFGISPNGGMKGADMVVGWIDGEGRPHLSDRHGTSNGFPPEDRQQDWVLLGGRKNGTHTTLKLRRLRNTCDEEDLPIGDDTMRLIWALGDDVPSGPDDFRPHDSRHRGSRSVYMVQNAGHVSPALQRELDSPDALRLEFKGDNVEVPSDYHTLYWCQIFEVPTGKAPHHLVKYEPFIEPGNEPYVHHMILYSCEDKLDMGRFKGRPQPCFDARAKKKDFSPMYSCTTKFLAGWAVGGEDHVFPEGVGYPFFDGEGDRFLMLETHYDNSAMDRGIRDSSGMVLHLTPKLRPMDAATITFGVLVDPMAMVLPPGQKNFTQYAYCPAECYEGLPAAGINVYAGLLHSHLAGRSMRVRHIRGGRELPPLIEDNHYDFNYQEMRTRSRPTKVLPGDSFITECTYDTTDRNETSFGGFSTQEEMCLAFVEYWPRQSVSRFCMSQPEPKTMYGWLGADVETVNGTAKVVEGMSPVDWVKRKMEGRGGAWEAEAVAELQRSVKDRLHVAMCMTQEAADVHRDQEAHREGIHMSEDASVRRREAKKALEFSMTLTLPEEDWQYTPLIRPDVCANRPRPYVQRKEGNSAARAALTHGFLATAVVNLLNMLACWHAGDSYHF